ncbi:fimbrial protein [Serratia sp. (in: enterobacteria)]|uniref:fimbrial protein n=1 Tax=Serratia sp. (in: enterobacteria) TaxID=616 RepID=UPI0039897039
MRILNRLKNTSSLILLMMLLSMSTGTHAACKTNVAGAGANSQIVTVYQQPIVVQRDLPVGSVIGTVDIPQSRPFELCNGLINGNYGSVTYELLLLTKTGVNSSYKTNVPGVGMVVPGFSSYPNTILTYYNNNTLVDISARKISLIKTGPIASGEITYQIIGKAYGDESVLGYTLYYKGASITQVGCSITTQNIRIPLEDVMVTSLTTVGQTANAKTFDVGLNCDAAARVNMKLIGTKNTDTSTAGVLQLSNAGGANVATGVGIQILYNGNPMVLNTNMVMKTSAGGQETFPFTAQYYQTKATPTTGSANATATLELTYQ